MAACPELPGELVPYAIVLVIYQLAIHPCDVRLFYIKLGGFLRGVCTVGAAPLLKILRIFATQYKFEVVDASLLKNLYQFFVILFSLLPYFFT